MFEEGKPQKGVTDGRSTTLSLSKTSRAKNGTVEGERARKDAPKTAQKEKIAADFNSKFISAKMALRDVSARQALFQKKYFFPSSSLPLHLIYFSPVLKQRCSFFCYRLPVCII